MEFVHDFCVVRVPTFGQKSLSDLNTENCDYTIYDENKIISFDKDQMLTLFIFRTMPRREPSCVDHFRFLKKYSKTGVDLEMPFQAHLAV